MNDIPLPPMWQMRGAAWSENPTASPVYRAMKKLVLYNSCVALVDQPGEECQWRASAGVVRALQCLDRLASWERASQAVSTLCDAVDVFAASTRLGVPELESGRWAAGEYLCFS